MIVAVDRFKSKIDKKDNGCWEWNGSLDSAGYGLLRVGKKLMKAHRYSFELYNYKIPKGLLVCHICDNPKCVNPSHLFIGSHKDNANDRDAKGRQYSPKGQESPNTSLSNDVVIDIKNRLNKGESNSSIANYYNVSKSIISRIKLRKTWAHI